MTLNDCCSSCSTCGVKVHLAGIWPINYCTHGLSTCDSCAPGDCLECTLEFEQVAS